MALSDLLSDLLEGVMKRIWGIRHIRWLWLSWRLAGWVEFCQKTGLGIAANQNDIDYLDAVRTGKA